MQIAQNDSDDADDMDTQIFSTSKTQMGADNFPHQQLEVNLSECIVKRPLKEWYLLEVNLSKCVVK